MRTRMSRGIERARRGRARCGIGAALAVLSAWLSGCAGVAVQLRDTADLDPVAVAAELVAAKTRRYPVTGVVCSFFFLAAPREASPDGRGGRLCEPFWHDAQAW